MSEQTDETDWEQRIQDETELITEKTSMTIQFDFRLPLSLITEIIDEHARNDDETTDDVAKRIAENYAHEAFRQRYNTNENGMIGSPRITVEDRGEVFNAREFRAVCVY